jgi:phage terminase small subunit
MSRLWRLVATAADRDQLAEYCRLEARRVTVEQEMARAEELKPGSSMISETAGGQPVRSAWMVVLDKTREDMRKIAVEFGGTPASRTRVKATGEEKTSKFQGLIGAA